MINHQFFFAGFFSGYSAWTVLIVFCQVWKCSVSSFFFGLKLMANLLFRLVPKISTKELVTIKPLDSTNSGFSLKSYLTILPCATTNQLSNILPLVSEALSTLIPITLFPVPFHSFTL